MPRRIPSAALVVAALVAGAPASAQDDSSAVLATVQRFFDTMTARDTVGARQVLVMDATYFSVRQTREGPVVRGSTNRAYVEQLASATETWAERMWDPEVKVHGAIAMVWTPYDFRVNGELSHCGVDAFSLIKTETGWKIASVVYTVEDDCEGGGP